MINIRNKNDILTDASAIGPTSPLKVIKSQTSYNEPGLPTPPEGWGRKLGIYDTESAEIAGPDTREGEQ